MRIEPQRCAATISSRPNRSPKAIPTRSPTRFPTPSSTCSSAAIRKRASPARRWSPPTASCSPARSAAATDVAPTQAEIEQAVRDTVKRIGYEQHGFHWQYADFACHLHGQSAHIAMGVDESGNKDEGAGDQGIMFGYATDETPDLMPATLYYSHRILERMAADRHGKKVDFLEPDAKSQVTLQYENGVPVRATAAGRLDPALARAQQRRRSGQASRLCQRRVRRRHARRAGCRPTRRSSSTRPACSRSAARTATPA